MSELPASRGPGNVVGIPASGLLLSCSALLISSLVTNSHLLFSCLVKLVVFLGPLFVTMSLVLLALLTLLLGSVLGGTGGTRRPGAVLGICSTVLNRFRSNADEGIGRNSEAFEDSEVYRIIFEVQDLENGRHGIGTEESKLPPAYKFPIQGDGNCLDEGIARPDIVSGKKLGSLFQEKPCCETEYLEDIEVKAKRKGFEKVVDKEKQDRHSSKSMKGSEAKIGDSGEDNNDMLVRRRFGDRRKEWNRTLAYKLLEERQDVEGEGMDSQWEAYNEDEFELWKKEEADEDEEQGTLCCLQALRLSAGIVEMSKALRGTGWLRRHRRRRSSLIPSHGESCHEMSGLNQHPQFITR